VPIEPSFDEFVDLIRVRLGMADDVIPSELHSFKMLANEYEAAVGDQWYWRAFEELDAEGHLDPLSRKAFGGDAEARLSAEGRYYLRTKTEES
jgi:hypothetical protein